MRKHPYPCKRCGGESYEKLSTLCTDRDNTSDSYLLWLRCPACDARYICDIVEYVSVYWDQDDVSNSGRVCEAAEWIARWRWQSAARRRMMRSASARRTRRGRRAGSRPGT